MIIRSDKESREVPKQHKFGNFIIPEDCHIKGFEEIVRRMNMTKHPRVFPKSTLKYGAKMENELRKFTGYRFSRMVTDKYAISISGFDKMPYFPPESQPLASLDFWLSYDEKNRDHAPAVYFYFEVLGFIVVDFSFYNINHACGKSRILNNFKNKIDHLLAGSEFERQMAMEKLEELANES